MSNKQKSQYNGKYLHLNLNGLLEFGDNEVSMKVTMKCLQRHLPEDTVSLHVYSFLEKLQPETLVNS